MAIRLNSAIRKDGILTPPSQGDTDEQLLAITGRLWDIPAALVVTRWGDGRILKSNKSFAQMFGHQEREILGRTVQDLQLYVRPDLRPVIMQRVRQAGRLDNELVAMRTKDGSSRMLQLSIQLIQLQGEDCLLSHAVDLTQQWELEQKVRESEERYRRLFNEAGNAICFYTLNPDGVPGKFIEVNTAMVHLFDYTREELAGMTPFDLVPELGLDEAVARGKRLLQGETTIGEYVMRTKGGQRLEIETCNSAYLWQGHTCVLTYIRDVTPKREAERALRLNEEILRVGLCDLGVMLFRQDLDLRFTWMFDSEKGYLSSMVVGTTDHDYMQKSDALALDELKRGVLSSGRPVRREMTINLHPPQGRRQYDYVLEPLRNEQGAIIGVTGAAIDITERQRSREELQNVRDLFQQIASTAPVGIFLADSGGRLTYVNEAAEQFSGRTRDSLLQMRLQDLVPQWDRQSTDEEWHRITADQTCFSGESCIVLPDGRERWGLVNVRRVPTSREQYQVIGTVTDITERVHEKQVLRALVEARSGTGDFLSKFLSRLVAQLNVDYAYLVECSHGGENCGRLLSGWAKGRALNPKTIKLPADCPGGDNCPVFGNCHQARVDRLVPNGGQSWAPNAQMRVIMPLCGKGGLVIGHVGVMSVQPLSDSGLVLRVLERAAVALAAEVEREREQEEKRKIELHLHQNQKMEALGALAGGIAHDFNNILTAVLNYTALAQMDHVVAMSPEVRGYLDEVRRAGLRARDLVKQILVFSRPDDMQSFKERRPKQLEDIVQEVLTLVKPGVPANIQMDLRVEPAVPRVMVDPVQIHQVVLNLCVNAVQAMKNQVGRITLQISVQRVASGPIEAGSLEPGNYVCLAVADTGCGIEPEVLARIYEPFFSTKTEEGGTGLGLAVVREIVRSHGGSIHVSSFPGKGTKFSILLPAAGFESSPADTGLVGELRGRGQRILVVDDEQPSLRSLSLLLSKHGFQVMSYSDPEQALAAIWLAPDKIDLLMTDLQMPHLTGIMLAERARSSRADLPVVLMSGQLNEVSAAQIERIGFTGILTKPVLTSHLAELFSRIFRSAD